MDLLTASELRELTSQSGICVSICMATHRAGAETLQDPIRLKNLLRVARSQLRGLGLDTALVHEILMPAAALVQDHDFWQHQSDGLAIYCAPGFYRLFRAPLSLPELAIVAARFHLKPLITLLAGNAHFYVLVLSQDRTRLFLAGREQISELSLPVGLADRGEANADRGRGGSLQSHSAGGGASRASVFHGHGDADEEKKQRLIVSFRMVNQSVRGILSKNPGPLILAGVDYLLPLFRQACSDPQVLNEAVSGNVDDLAPIDLLERALPIALAHFSKAEERAADQFNRLAHTGLASSDLPTVLNAASAGRVQSLFVAVGVQTWGVYRPEERELAIFDGPAPEAEDLLNLAAMYTFMNSGEVYAVQPDRVPGGGPLAATFRY
jgi:hypothetical protein